MNDEIKKKIEVLKILSSFCQMWAFRYEGSVRGKVWEERKERIEKEILEISQERLNI